MSAIQNLPNELKLEILLCTNFISGTLFSICSAIPEFNQVYQAHETIIQRHIQKRDHFEGSVELLDRFRMNEEGMGYLQLKIFENLHNWLAPVEESPDLSSSTATSSCCDSDCDACNESQSYDGDEESDELKEGCQFHSTQATGSKSGMEANRSGDRYTLKEPKEKIMVLVAADDIEEERKAFGKRNGFITNMAEVDFLLDIEAKVDLYLYEETRKFGLRDPAMHRKFVEFNFAWGLEHDMAPVEDFDDVEQEYRVRRAIIQFLILTTYAHDEQLADYNDSAFDRSYTVEQRKSRQVLEWKETWDNMLRCHGSNVYFLDELLVEIVVYDYTYANKLSISDLVAVLSVAAPLLNCFYLFTTLHQDCKHWLQFREGWFLRHYIAHRCGFETDEQSIIAPSEKWHRSLYRMFLKVVNSGVWNPGYFLDAKHFQEMLESVGHRLTNWEEDYEEKEIYTMAGHSSDAVKRKAFLTKFSIYYFVFSEEFLADNSNPPSEDGSEDLPVTPVVLWENLLLEDLIDGFGYGSD